MPASSHSVGTAANHTPLGLTKHTTSISLFSGTHPVVLRFLWSPPHPSTTSFRLDGTSGRLPDALSVRHAFSVDRRPSSLTLTVVSPLLYTFQRPPIPLFLSLFSFYLAPLLEPPEDTAARHGIPVLALEPVPLNREQVTSSGNTHVGTFLDSRRQGPTSQLGLSSSTVTGGEAAASAAVVQYTKAATGVINDDSPPDHRLLQRGAQDPTSLAT